jgi:hypothetical protein
MGERNNGTHPLWLMSEADLELILRLVLASGSLKMLAQSYGVSYPTIRSRLDAVIERLRAAMNGQPQDPMARVLADLVAKGEMTPAAAQVALETHHRETEKSNARILNRPANRGVPTE